MAETIELKIAKDDTGSRLVQWRRGEGPFTTGILAMVRGERQDFKLTYSGEEYPDISYIEVSYPSGETALLETGSPQWQEFSYANKDGRLYEYEDDKASLYIVFKLHLTSGESERWMLRTRVENAQVAINFRLAGVSLRNDGNASYILADGTQLVIVQSGDFRAENRLETVEVASPVETTKASVPEEEPFETAETVDVGLRFEIDHAEETARLVWSFGAEQKKIEESIVSIGFEITDNTLSGALTSGVLTDETVKDGETYSVDCPYENNIDLTGTQAEIISNLLKGGHSFDISLSLHLNNGAVVKTVPCSYTPVPPGTMQIGVETPSRRYMVVAVSWEGAPKKEVLDNTYSEITVSVGGEDYEKTHQMDSLSLSTSGALEIPVPLWAFPPGTEVGEIVVAASRRDGKPDSAVYPGSVALAYEPVSVAMEVVSGGDGEPSRALGYIATFSVPSGESVSEYMQDISLLELLCGGEALVSLPVVYNSDMDIPGVASYLVAESSETVAKVAYTTQGSYIPDGRDTYTIRATIGASGTESESEPATLTFKFAPPAFEKLSTTVRDTLSTGGNSLQYIMEWTPEAWRATYGGTLTQGRVQVPGVSTASSMTFSGLSAGEYRLSAEGTFQNDWRYKRKGSMEMGVEVRGDFVLEQGFHPLLAKDAAYGACMDLGLPLKAAWDFGRAERYLENAVLQEGSPYFEVFKKKNGPHSPGDLRYEEFAPVSFSDILKETLPPQYFMYSLWQNGYDFIWDASTGHYNSYKANFNTVDISSYLAENGLPASMDPHAAARKGLAVFRKRIFRAGRTG